MSLAAVPAYFLARLFVSIRPRCWSHSHGGRPVDDIHRCGHDRERLLPGFPPRRPPDSARRTSADWGESGAGSARPRPSGIHADPGPRLGSGVPRCRVGLRIHGSACRRGPYLRRFVPTAALLLAVRLIPVFMSIARGDGAFGWLGPRSNTFAQFQPWEIPQWFVYLVAGLVLYVALIPVAASAVVIGRGLALGFRTDQAIRSRCAVHACRDAPLGVARERLARCRRSVNLNERYVFYSSLSYSSGSHSGFARGCRDRALGMDRRRGLLRAGGSPARSAPRL